VSHVATDDPADQVRWQLVKPYLNEAGFQGLTVKELAEAKRLNVTVLRDFMHRKSLTGEVIAVTSERFYLRTTLIHFTHVVQRASVTSEDGLFSVAQVRDLAGIGRGLVIQILERFDRLGVTRRVGDRRTLKPDFESVFFGIGVVKPKKSL
jgi:selenocysteine-specific elongation factor